MTTYRRLMGRELSDWILQLLVDRSDVAFSVEHVQSALVRRGYAAPSLQEIKDALEGWVAKAKVVKPFPTHYQLNTLGPSISGRVVTTLLTRTINDITRDQMNRIVRRLARMPTAERGIPKRVAEVIADELGTQKALEYIDKALGAGQISVREYDEMRATLLLLLPRKEIPPPTVRAMTQEIVETQRRIREDFKKLTGQGQQAFRRPFTAVDEDVKRIKRSLGL